MVFFEWFDLSTELVWYLSIETALAITAIYTIAGFLMFVINSIFNGINLKLSTIIYYLILILTGVIGGTIGINKKKEDN